MKNLPTDLLRTFTTVVSVGGFTRAGEVVGRSQSAVSLQVRRLEGLVGFALLDRLSHRPQLTEEGQTLHDYARRMLALNDEALGCLAKPGVSGSVRFGAPSEFAASFFLPEILEKFAQSHPSVTLEVTFALSKHLLARLSKNEYDLIIAAHDSPADKSGLKVSTEKIVWITSLDHDKHTRTPVPLIAAHKPCIYRSKMIAALNNVEKRWNIGYTSSSYNGIIAAVRAGLGVTALPQSAVPNNVRILAARDKFPPLDDVEVRLHYIRAQASKAVLRFADYIATSIMGAPETGNRTVPAKTLKKNGRRPDSNAPGRK